MSDDVVRARGSVLHDYFFFTGHLLYGETAVFDKVQHGFELMYHANGAIATKCMCVKSNYHGLYEGFHNTGARQFWCMYIHGKPRGMARWWDVNGTLYKEINTNTLAENTLLPYE